ncbi:MAG: cadmium-translocating P-type ATPase [marine benthic group bacterium]|jgi:Cd2+/Zn2+-exporting ATPase|nr:cadmium-translocating P-type ATPase [Candidatus Benthicola marisminoris]
MGQAEPGTARVEFRVEDMDCASCLDTIRRSLEKRPGIEGVQGSPVARRLEIDYDPGVVDPERLRREIGDLGYRVLLPSAAGELGIRAWSSPRAYRTYLAGVLFFAGLALRLALHGTIVDSHGGPAWPGGEDLLFVAAALVGALNFIPRALGALRGRVLDMHVLMLLAVIGATAIGEYMEAAAIAFLFSVAELLEGFAAERAEASVRSLMELSPEVARVRRDGREVTVRAADVAAGDLVVVRPGERVPIDGQVVDGHSAVNEAPITGEAMPVEKSPGEHVFAGSILHEGYLVVRSERDAGDTTLARMIRLIEEAERRRSPSERFVEKFARYYTPAVTVGAFLVVLVPVFFFGQPFPTWLLRGLTLLVIACPCALVISTPVSVVSAITSGARHGVLVKGGASLERMADVRVMAFDKTGTLTHGRAEVTDVLPLDGVEAERLLAVAAAVESRSEHPIGRAIVRAAGAAGDGLHVDDFASFPGQGARARVEGVIHLVGRPSLADEASVPELDRLAESGKTPVVVLRVSEDGRRDLIGILALTDPLRPSVPEVIRRLRELGLERVVVLSGDLARAAEEAGREAGADDVWSRLEPAAKVETVKQLERQTGHVAMVGDGVNDAPALAAASVGIAMGAAASDAALETADIAVMGDDLGRLPYLYRLARRSRRVIRQNIAAALAVKLILAVGVPLGWVSLIVAVLVGDMGASLVVTANALRLARVRE